MRYQVPVTVSVRANTAGDAKYLVERLVAEAPTAHRVSTRDWKFAVGDAAEVQIVRSDRTLNLSDDELAVVQEALAEYRDE